MDARTRHLLVVCLAVVLAVGAAGCDLRIGGSGGQTIEGSGAVQSDERPVADIEAVQVSNEGDLTVEIGDTERLVVEAQQEILPYIETDMDGDTLVISTRDDYDLDPSEPIRYRLTVPTLSGLMTSSSGDIVGGDVTTDSLEIRVTSSGNVTVDKLDAEGLLVEITSSGNVTIGGGAVDDQEVRLTSSGSYDGEDLSSGNATVELTSSGDASVRVSRNLDGRLTSSGNVLCFGSPEVDVETTSSGKVETSPE